MSFFQLTQGAALACAGLGAAAATIRTRAMYRFWTTSQVGTRDLIYIPIPEVVFDDLRGRTADQKTTVDQLAADLLAAITGHPELVRDLDREARCPTSLLAHAIDTRRAHPDIGTRIRTEVRIPLPVSAEIRAWTVTRASDAGQIAADLLAIATGHPEGVRHLDRLDMLRLASATLFATVDGITAGAHGRCTE